MANAVTSSDFDSKVLEAEGVVLVDFWAGWCAPCVALAPIIENVSKSNKNATVLKLNVDENPDIAMKYEIRGIPTVKLFKDGQEVETIIGLKPQAEYDKLIEKHA